MSRDSMSASPLIVPQLSSRRGWKPVQRVTEDRPPTILWREADPCCTTSSKDHAVPSTKEEMACSVCQQHQSRYTCPRCQTPYCSVECYRNHTNSTSTVETSACTEVFFKNRVSSILELEAREQKDSTQRMLNQHYQSIQQNVEDGPDLSDQLLELLQLLDNKQVTNHHSQDDLLAMMPQELRMEFQRDLQEGKLQQMILQPWHPWWKRQFVVSSEDSTQPSSLPPSKTLDERLLRVPPFSSLVRNKQQSPQLLLYHLIDILYSYCWTIRLYNGLENVIAQPTQTRTMEDGSLAVDAAACFLQNSAVLNNDIRYTSLEQVLTSCTAISTKVFPDGCNAEWFVLVEDCAHILGGSHRQVGRALLEACDFFKVSIHHLKKEDLDEHNNNNKETIVRLRQLRKKLEFFLSWSQHSKEEFGESIKVDLMEWLHRWHSNQFTSGMKEGEGTDLTELAIPTASSSATSHQSSRQVPKSPLMVEVATRRNSSRNK